MNSVTWFIGSGALNVGLMKTDNRKVKHGVYSIKMEINYAQLKGSFYKVYFLFQYINPNRMHKSQSLFYLTTPLHVSGVTITHLQEHKTNASTASGNCYTVIDRVKFTDKEFR